MQRTAFAPPVWRQTGLTLIELMISITLGLVILAALGYTYVSSRGVYRSTENLARMQEAGRSALQFLTEDLRMTSFYGCRSRLITGQEIIVVSSPAIPVAPVATAAPVGVQGWDSSGGPAWTNPSSITRVGGDVITVWRAEAGQSAQLAATTDPVARTARIVHNGPNFRNDDVVMLANCEGAVLFRVTNSPAQGVASTNVDLQYAATGAGPGGTRGNSASFPAMDVSTHASAYRFGQTTYFIGRNPANRPALYRTSDTGLAEEVVDNVEDMDIVYGVDTDGDFIANSYLRADQVTDWAQVIAVRVSLLVAGPQVAAGTNVQTYLLRDTDGDAVLDTQTAADTRLRQVFTSTIALRNRTQ